MTKQILHLVFGGELTALDKVEFKDLGQIHFLGLYPNFAKASEAWKAAAQATVDNAHMRYFVVHLHQLLQPDIVLDSKPAPRPRALASKQKLVKAKGMAGNARNRK